MQELNEVQIANVAGGNWLCVCDPGMIHNSYPSSAHCYNFCCIENGAPGYTAAEIVYFEEGGNDIDPDTEQHHNCPKGNIATILGGNINFAVISNY